MENRILLDVKKNHFLIRVIVGNFLFLMIFLLVEYFRSNDNISLIFAYSLGAVLLLIGLFKFKREKYYIYKITYDENEINLSYLNWTKKVVLKLKWNEFSIERIKKFYAYPGYIGLNIIYNDLIISQYIASVLTGSYWNFWKLKKMYEKIIELQKTYKEVVNSNN